MGKFGISFRNHLDLFGNCWDWLSTLILIRKVRLRDDSKRTRKTAKRTNIATDHITTHTTEDRLTGRFFNTQQRRNTRHAA